MSKPDKWTPCKFIDFGDGLYGLLFDDFDATLAFFEERELEGGGYTWHAVVDALVRTRLPEIARCLQFDPESSMFAVRSSDKDALESVAALIRNAQTNRSLLREAISHADLDLLE